MSKKDYYQVLGIDKTSSDEEIKRSYRKLAMKYHPDRNEGSTVTEEQFKEVKEAYEHLSDPDKRRQYDQYGHEDPFMHAQQPRYNTNTWGSNISEQDFQDIFSSIFGGAGSYRANANKQTYLVTITLAQAYSGTTVKVDNTTNLGIPKGVRNDTRLYLDNRIFKIHVQPDIKFKRTNDDLLVDISITAIEAMLGVSAILDHLDGSKLQFTIPWGIQVGQVVRLISKGMKNPENDRFGDLLIRVNITIPKTLTTQELAAIQSINHRPTINI